MHWTLRSSQRQAHLASVSSVAFPVVGYPGIASLVIHGEASTESIRGSALWDRNRARMNSRHHVYASAVQ